jgi:hypothetical protein
LLLPDFVLEDPVGVDVLPEVVPYGSPAQPVGSDISLFILPDGVLDDDPGDAPEPVWSLGDTPDSLPGTAPGLAWFRGTPLSLPEVTPGLVWSLGVTPDSLPGTEPGLVWPLGAAPGDAALLPGLELCCAKLSAVPRKRGMPNIKPIMMVFFIVSYLQLFFAHLCVRSSRKIGAASIPVNVCQYLLNIKRYYYEEL